MTIPALPSLDRTSPTFRTDLDTFFLSSLPATTSAFNSEIDRINAIGYGSYNATSTTSLTVGTGTKSLTVDTGKSFSIGQPISMASTASPSNWMSGQVTGYDSGTGALVVNVMSYGGTGLHADWSISPSAFVASVPTVGDIKASIAGAAAPSPGVWLEMSGSIYMQSAYPDLYSVIGLLPDMAPVVGTAVSGAMPSTAYWGACAYGSGVFLAISSEASNKCATSFDGVTWSAGVMPAAQSWMDCVYEAGRFVAVSKTGTDRVATSSDGVTWVSRTASSAQQWSALAYGDGMYCAVAPYSLYAMTSPDGVAWTSRTLPVSANWGDVAFGNGIFFALNQTPSGACAKSTDGGVTWESVPNPESGVLSKVVFGNGVFIAFVMGSTSAYKSTDCITWVPVTLPSIADRYAIGYGNGLFVAFATGTTNYVTSTDGVTWTARTLATSNTWLSDIAYGNGRFVSPASNSANSAVIPINDRSYDISTQFYVPALMVEGVTHRVCASS